MSDSLREPKGDAALTLLAPRFANDGKASIPLSPIQKQARARFQAKVDSGDYQFAHRPCALCGTDAFTLVARKDRYALWVDTGICRHCGLPQTLNTMRRGDYDDFYSSLYRDLYDPGNGPALKHQQRKPMGRSLLATLRRVVPSLTGGRVVEVGCSAGGILSEFAKAGFDVRGYDFDERFLSYGRSQGLDLRFGAIEDVEEESFADVVVASHVVEHLFNLRASLRAMRRLLVPGGMLLIEVPGFRAIDMASHSLDLLRYLQNAHLYHFDRALLVRLLAEEGFECLYADEVVRGVFRKTDVAQVTGTTEHDDTLRAWREIERRRRENRIRTTLSDLNRVTRSRLGPLVRRLGLRPRKD